MSSNPTVPRRVCIYCAGARGNLPFSDEHIWPRALGGDACPLLFWTEDVCVRCNSLAGLWVDATFTKSWYVQMGAALAARIYLNPEIPGILPLTYMGFDEEFPCEPGDVCERWLGPSGEQVYHIHQADEPRWETVAGGDVIRRRDDPGRVYFMLSSTSQYWAITGLKSINAKFGAAQRRTLTRIDGLRAEWGILQADEGDITSGVAREIAFIMGRPPGLQSHRMPINIHFADRFLAKLALGLGHNVLGPAVSNSAHAAALRKMLWPSPDDTRYEGIHGLGFWQAKNFDERAASFIGWRGAWTIMLQALNERFVLTLFSPSLRVMIITLSEDPGLWPEEAKERYKDGIVHIIVPQRAICIGPIPLPFVVAHRIGYPSPDLVRLEGLQIDPATLPPAQPETTT